MLMLCNTNTLKPVLTGQAESLPLKARVSGLPRLSTCLPMGIPLSNCKRAGPGFRSQRSREPLQKQQNSSVPKYMPKPFYKHKTLLDEHLLHRRLYPLLNEHFDVKHIRDDLRLGGLPDPEVYALAVKQGRIILTTNVKDFRPLLREDSPGIIGIPEAWSLSRIDTKLTALLMEHGSNYFRGCYRSLAAEDQTRQVA